MAVAATEKAIARRSSLAWRKAKTLSRFQEHRNENILKENLRGALVQLTKEELALLNKLPAPTGGRY